MECLICCDVPTNTVPCSNKSCHAVVCTECCGELITVSGDNSVLPECPSINCRTFYVYSQVASLGKEVVAKYSQSCFAVFAAKEGDAVKKKVEYQKILEDLRQERRRFIREKLPAAIVLVAETALPRKLRKIEKQKAESISEQVDNAKRTCMNLFCDGHLDEDLRCMTCATAFCKKCEKRIGEKHKCKAEDVESLDFIRNMIHCPGCSLTIQKSEGCNNMTCAHCGTKFNYGTGEKSGDRFLFGIHGSNNKQVMVKKKQRLSIMYDNGLSPKETRLLAQIEDSQPPLASLARINNILTKYYQKKVTQQVCAMGLARAFEEYTMRQTQQRTYQNRLNEIETKLQAGEPTLAHLRVFIRQLAET